MTRIPRRFARWAGAACLTFATLSPAVAASPGVDLAAMDTAVKPGDDFFAYANGAWAGAAEIPADRSTWGATAQMRELTDKRNAELIQAAAAAKAAPGSEAQKVGDYYAAFMDEAAIEAKGLAPVKPELARIAAIKDRRQLAAMLGSLMRADVDMLNATDTDTERPLGLWVAQDLDAPTRYAAFLIQGGLLLPDRDYYLSEAPRMEAIRTAYKAHIAKVMTLAGYADADVRAGRIYALEHAIAEGHASRSETDDVKAGNNHWARADFAKRAPGLDWSAYFAAAGLARQPVFVVWQPKAVASLSALAAGQPLDAWKDYLAFHALERSAGVLPKPFADEQFAFYSSALSGTPAQRVRWKRAVDATNDALGDAVGKIYVARYFPPQAKAEVQAMVENIKAAFARRIDALDWMAPETKREAKAKLAVLKVGVGYPDRWRDYSGLVVRRDDAYGNRQRAALFEYRYRLAQLGKPVDRDEWVMTPQTVNAVNLPAMNALNFPAAELQAPIFDPAAPAAVNYGAVGSVIGHEISHSFDDTGALFDATGRLRNWWTPSDFARFKASGDALAKQYDAYRPFPDLALSGELTLGENIADVAGLAAAYDAYRLSLGGKPAPVVGGLTGDQQFFVAFAQGWRWKAREAAYRRLVATDGHAPSPYRVATVRNLDAWYAAFGVQPGQALYLPPAERVKVW
jgi:predicted metalloendopeptidase